MKNNYVKNLPKASKNMSTRRKKIMAWCLLVLFVFWSVCSVLGVIAFFRSDNTSSLTAYADSQYTTYRDSIEADPNSTFFYKPYDFIGQANRNFSSPFRIEVKSSSMLALTIYMRFDESNYNAPNGFGLFINSQYVYTPAFTRILLDDLTYYSVTLSNTLMNKIVSQYKGVFSIMSLNYDYDTPIHYDFDLFITRGSSQTYSPAYFEGFLASDDYERGFADGLKASDYSSFFNGFGDLTYKLNGSANTVILNLVPSVDIDYFSNGQFLFSKYIVDKVGRNNLSRLTSLSFHFRLAETKSVGINNYLTTFATGIYSNLQSLGFTITYSNFTDTGAVPARSEPIAMISNNGAVNVNDQFSTTNLTPVYTADGVVYTYGDVLVDTISIRFNLSTFISVISPSSNSIILGFPTGFNNGYTAGFIDGQKSYDGDIFFQNGYEKGKYDGSQFLKAEWQKGYDQGVKDSGNITFLSLFSAIIDAPIQAITGLLNFEILGFNLMNLFMGLVTLGLIVFVLRLFL